jgi:hypothetical protein
LLWREVQIRVDHEDMRALEASRTSDAPVRAFDAHKQKRFWQASGISCLETISNDPKTLEKQLARPRVCLAGGQTMTDRQLREQEVQIAHYKLLSREVTDPLAACLLRVVIEELEADLRRDRDIDQNCFDSRA